MNLELRLRENWSHSGLAGPIIQMQVGEIVIYYLQTQGGRERKIQEADMKREAETEGGKKILTANPVPGPRSFLKPGCILIPGFLDNLRVCRINSSFCLNQLSRPLVLTSKSSMTVLSNFNFGILHF